MSGLSYQQRSELEDEAHQLELAIMRMAQRVKPPSVTEQQQVERWLDSLAKVRKRLETALLGGRYGASRRMRDQLDQMPQFADPRAIQKFLFEDRSEGVA